MEQTIHSSNPFCEAFQTLCPERCLRRPSFAAGLVGFTKDLAPIPIVFWETQGFQGISWDFHVYMTFPEAIFPFHVGMLLIPSHHRSGGFTGPVAMI